MNRRFALSWLAAFVIWMAGSFAIHGALLRADYAALPALFRPESETTGTLMALMIAAHVVMSGAFVWIYARGVTDAPWVGQGLRFGLAIALLAVIPTYTIYFVVQPMPAQLSVMQAALDGALVIVLGVVTASFHRAPVSG